MKRGDLLEILKVEVSAKVDANALVYKSHKRTISPSKIEDHKEIINIFVTRQRRTPWDTSPKSSKATLDFVFELIVGTNEDDVSTLDDLVEKIKAATISNDKILDNFQDPEITDINYIIESENEDHYEKALVTGSLSLIEPDGFDASELPDYAGYLTTWNLL